MGVYLNADSSSFEEAVNSEIYIDKTEMILFLNSVVKTKQKYVSVSRPRRFGKSMAVDMICAYSDCKNDIRSLFENCKLCINSNKNDCVLSWDHYLRKFNVIKLVMTDFFKTNLTIENGIKRLKN